MSKLHQLGPKVLPGISLGYVLNAGENLEKRRDGCRTLKNWRRCTCLNFTPEGSMQRKCHRRRQVTIFKFRDAYGTVKTPGRDRRLNHPLIRDHPERGEEQEVFRGESDGLSSPTLQDDSTRDDEEAKKDVWSITGDFFSACDLVHHRRSSKWPHARHASVNETSGAPFFSGFWVMS